MTRFFFSPLCAPPNNQTPRCLSPIDVCHPTRWKKIVLPSLSFPFWEAQELRGQIRPMAQRIACGTDHTHLAKRERFIFLCAGLGKGTWRCSFGGGWTLFSLFYWSWRSKHALDWLLPAALLAKSRSRDHELFPTEKNDSHFSHFCGHHT